MPSPEPIDEQGSGADPNIGDLLKDLAEANEAGRLRCIVAIALDEDRGTRIAILGRADHDKILGAIERLKWTLLKEEEDTEPDSKSTKLH